MFLGSPIGAALTDSSFLVRSIVATQIGNSIYYRFEVYKWFRNAYIAPFINGRYIGKNIWIGSDGIGAFDALSSGSNSLYLEDAGQFATFPPGTEPSYNALVHQQFTSKYERITWTAKPSYSTIGDNPFGSLSLSGAARGHNCAVDIATPTRARIGYSVYSLGSEHQISFWNEPAVGPRKLVAYASITGNGSFIATEQNNSGLTISGAFTYASDLQPGDQWLALRWPKSYELHWSTSALSFPRNPDAVQNDLGGNVYKYLTTELPNATIHYAVVARSDEGVLESSPMETGTVEVKHAPAAPLNLSVTGTAAALVLDWDLGESGCTHTVYASDADAPVNYGTYPTPAPVALATDVHTYTAPAITGYAPVDTQAAFVTLKTAFDTQAAALVTAYNAGQTGFESALSTVSAGLLGAIDTYCDALGLSSLPFKDYLNAAFAALTFDAALYKRSTASAWTLLSSSAYPVTKFKYILQFSPGTGEFLTGAEITIGSGSEVYTIRGTVDDPAYPNLYAINPSLAVDKSAGNAVNLVTPTGWADDLFESVDAALGKIGVLLTGDTYYKLPGVNPPVVTGINKSLYESGLPFEPVSPKYRFGVAAKKGGIEEKSFTEIEVRFYADGSIVQPLPNTARINKIDFDGLKVIVDAGVVEDNTDSAAKYLDLYVTPYGTDPDWSTPSASVDLPTAVSNYTHALVNYTPGSAGNYTIHVKARNASGHRSYKPDSRTHALSLAAPVHPDVSGDVTGAL